MVVIVFNDLFYCFCFFLWHQARMIALENWNNKKKTTNGACRLFKESEVRILHWPNVNLSGHKKWISRLHSTKVWNGTLRGLCLCKFDIPGCRMLAAHKTGSEIVSQGDPNALVSKCSPMSKGCWTAELLKVATPKSVT